MEIKFTSEITVRIIQSMGGDHMVVAAAKVSTHGEQCLEFSRPGYDEDNYGLINYLMKHRHGTPFEHSSMTFFVHAPIFVWREWHRHRIGFSYNESSARYKEMEPIFWIPKRSRKMIPSDKHKSARPDFIPLDNDKEYNTIVRYLEAIYSDCWISYQDLLKINIAKEVARCVLPVGIYSSCWVTCNPRSLMSFLSLRTHEINSKFVSYPQAEIEEASRVCEQFLEQGWPLTYRAFNENGRVAP